MRHYGVEIECGVRSAQNFLQAARRNGIDIREEGYNHSTRNHWKVVTDASVSVPGLVTIEVVSPKLEGEAGMAEVKGICDALAEAGAKVNTTCGLHVHVDAIGMTTKWMGNLIKKYRTLETAIDQLMPKSRRNANNQYCKPVKEVTCTRTEAELYAKVDMCTTLLNFTGLMPARYRKLNVQAFWRHGTIEFRRHSGTTEFEKIANWITFCIAFMERTQAGTPRANSKGTTEYHEVTRLFEYLGAAADGIRAFYRTRQRHFAEAEGRTLDTGNPTADRMAARRAA